MPDETRQRLYEVAVDTEQGISSLEELQAKTTQVDASFERMASAMEASLNRVEAALGRTGASVSVFTGLLNGLSDAMERFRLISSVALNSPLPMESFGLASQLALPAGQNPLLLGAGQNQLSPFALSVGQNPLPIPASTEIPASQQVIDAEYRVLGARANVPSQTPSLLGPGTSGNPVQVTIAGVQGGATPITGQGLTEQEISRINAKWEQTMARMRDIGPGGGAGGIGGGGAGGPPSVPPGDIPTDLPEEDSTKNKWGWLERSILRNLIVYQLMYTALQQVNQELQKEAELLIAVDRASQLAAYSTGQNVEVERQLADQAASTAAAYGRPGVEGAGVFAEATRVTKTPADQAALTQQAFQIATVTGAQPEAELQAIITLDRQWGLTINDNKQLLDLLAVTYKESNIPLDSMLKTLTEGASIGKNWGLTLQQMAAYTTAFAEVTGRTDPSRATAFFQIMQANLDSVNKTAGLEKLGISTRDAQESLRPLPEILQQVNAHWETWNETDRQTAVHLIAGTRYANDFINFITKGMPEAIRLTREYNDAIGQGNQFLQANQNTIGFQLNRLRETFTTGIGKAIFPDESSTQAYARGLSFISDHLEKVLGITIKLLAPTKELTDLMTRLVFGGPPPVPYESLQRVEEDRTSRARAPQPLNPEYDRQNRIDQAIAQATGEQAPRINQTRLSYEALLQVQEQSEQKAQQTIQTMAQQAAAAQGLSGDQEAIARIAQQTADKYKDHVIQLQSIGGQLVIIKGLAAEYANEIARASEIPAPQLRFENISPASYQQQVGIANQLVQNYQAGVLQSNLTSEQKISVLEQANQQWAKQVDFVQLANGQMQLLQGPAAAFLSQSKQIQQTWESTADQIAKAMKAAMEARGMPANPNIQAMPELTPELGGKLQSYLSQYERLFASMGIRQKPEEYLIFGQGGFLAKYITSSDAMSLAMDMLREEVKQNTETQKDTLRGHYNIPTDYGYKPPTPWEFYAKTGSQEMGPVNYPWNFQDEQGGDGYWTGTGKNRKFHPTLGRVPTGGADFFQTTLGTESTLINNARADVIANSAAFRNNTAAVVANTGAVRADALDILKRDAQAERWGRREEAAQQVTQTPDAAEIARRRAIYAATPIQPARDPGLGGNLGANSTDALLSAFAGTSLASSGASSLETKALTVNGIPEIGEKTGSVVTNTASMAGQIPPALQSISSSILSGNSILLQMLSQLVVIASKTNQPTPVTVNVTVPPGSNEGSSSGTHGTTTTRTLIGAGGTPALGQGARVRY